MVSHSVTLRVTSQVELKRQVLSMWLSGCNIVMAIVIGLKCFNNGQTKIATDGYMYEIWDGELFWESPIQGRNAMTLFDQSSRRYSEPSISF